MANGAWNISDSLLLRNSPVVWESPIGKQFQTEKYTSLFLIAYLSYILIMLLLSIYIGFCCSFPSWCCCFLKETSCEEEFSPPCSSNDDYDLVERKQLIFVDCKAAAESEEVKVEHIPRTQENVVQEILRVFSIAENIKKLVKIGKSLHRQQRRDLLTRISAVDQYRSTHGLQVVS